MRLKHFLPDSKEKCAAFLSFAHAIHSSIEVSTHAAKVNYHCFLYGAIKEKERVFTEGVFSICLVYLLTCYTLVVFCLYLWVQNGKYPKYNW